jgi:transposase-like protein
MGWSVAHTCRHFGIARKTFYKWKKRHAHGGDAALSDRARIPLRCPKATPSDVVSKILYLRQQYHFGPRRIAGLPQALPRALDCRVLRPSHSATPPAASAAGKPEVSATRETVAALREAPARTPSAAGREVPGADSWQPTSPVPIHGHR